MTTNRHLGRGLGALLALATATAGFPALLLAVTGSPDQLQFSGSGAGLSGPLTDTQLLSGLTVICWAIWLAFLASVITEAIAWWRGSSTSVPIFGGAARSLLLAVALLFTSTSPPLPPLSQHLPSTTALAVEVSSTSLPDASPVAATKTGQATLRYTVAPRDDLWTLAERHLGDPMRWRELFDLNKGAAQPNGDMLSSPELIRPGWVLQFPGDAVNLPPTVMPPTPVFIPPAETSPPQASGEPDVAAELPAPTSSAPSDSAQYDQVAISPILGAGLMTAGVVALLDQLRRRRRRHRRTGTFDLPLSGKQGTTEALLRVGTDAAPARRLDLACRALAHRLSESSEVVRVDAVRVGNSEIEFLFDSPPTADPVPFVVGSEGYSWTIPADMHEVRVGAFAAEMSAPIPALVHIGSLDGADVLIDLERNGITSINGADAHDLVSAMLLQLATSVWADHVDLITIGITSPMASERTRAFASLDLLPDLAVGMTNEIRASLEDERLASTFRARCTQELNDGWIPTVIVLPASLANGPKFERLVTIAGSGGFGLSIVVVDGEIEGSRVITRNGDSTIVSDPSLTLTSLPIDGHDIDNCAQVLDAAPTADTYDLPDAQVDLREIVDLPTVPELSVNVLGPVEIVGGEERVSRRRAAEVVAFLALHPKGVGDDELKNAVWPQQPPTAGSFNTTISLARRELGADSTGTPFVVPSKRGHYSVASTVGSDLDRFEKLFALAKSSSDSEAVRLLSGALEMVRGLPFASVRSGYQWAHTEGFIARAEAIVADAAHKLAQLHLAAGNASDATWAARRGLLASPGYEVLYRDLMLACEIDGNLAALETIMSELNAYLDVVDPADNLESETTALYDRLRKRRSPMVSQ